ncbi:unnamed protein product [Absidia cylindrospora]
MQIMDLDCRISAMSLVENKLCVIQKVAEFEYPRTLREIRTGEINNLLQGLEHANVMMENLKNSLAEYSQDTRNMMKRWPVIAS